MKIVQVSEVADLDDGDIIKALSGKITKVYERKEGGDEKPWTVQNAFFADSTGEIRVSAWNHDDLTRFKGKEIAIEAHHGDKGWSGVYVEDNEWPKNSGKITRQVKLTATASIALVRGDEKADPSPASAPRTRPDAKPAAARRAADNAPTAPPVKAAKQIAAQAATGIAIALEQAVAIRFKFDAEFKDHPMADAQFQAITSTIFISMKDKGCIDALPIHPIDPPKPEKQATDFSQAQEAMSEDEPEIPF